MQIYVRWTCELNINWGFLKLFCVQFFWKIMLSEFLICGVLFILLYNKWIWVDYIWMLFVFGNMIHGSVLGSDFLIIAIFNIFWFLTILICILVCLKIPRPSSVSRLALKYWKLWCSLLEIFSFQGSIHK